MLPVDIGIAMESENKFYFDSNETFTDCTKSKTQIFGVKLPQNIVHGGCRLSISKMVLFPLIFFKFLLATK